MKALTDSEHRLVCRLMKDLTLDSMELGATWRFIIKIFRIKNIPSPFKAVTSFIDDPLLQMRCFIVSPGSSLQYDYKYHLFVIPLHANWHRYFSFDQEITAAEGQLGLEILGTTYDTILKKDVLVFNM